MLHKSPKGEIHPEDTEFIDYVLENYARYSGSQIEAMTHSETPWINARKGYGPVEKFCFMVSERRYEKQGTIYVMATRILFLLNNQGIAFFTSRKK